MNDFRPNNNFEQNYISGLRHLQLGYSLQALAFGKMYLGLVSAFRERLTCYLRFIRSFSWQT